MDSLLFTQFNALFCDVFEDIDECALNISGCNQNCTNTIGSHFCSCYLGFKILPDNRTCIGKDCASNPWICCYLQCLINALYCDVFEDIDECALNISGCNQNCTNTNGSYICSCYPGFEILNDNRTCIGKNCASNSWIRCHCFVMYLKILTSVH